MDLVNYPAFFRKNCIILYQISLFSCTFGKLSVSLHANSKQEQNYAYRTRETTKTFAFLARIDNFTLFYFQFMANYTRTSAYWSQKINQPQFNTWSGFAYERVCMQHIEQIKQAIGISRIRNNL